MTISLHIEPHPDELQNQQAVKHITRGSREAADDASIAAYIKAYEEGKSEEEISRIYFETYKTALYGNTNLPGSH